MIPRLRQYSKMTTSQLEQECWGLHGDDQAYLVERWQANYARELGVYDLTYDDIAGARHGFPPIAGSWRHYFNRYCFCTDCCEARDAGCEDAQDYNEWVRAFPALPWES